MAPKWSQSSLKHGVARADAIHAILHATFTDRLNEEVPGGWLTIYIGPAYSQTEREIEVLVHHFADGRDAVVFHVMPLGSKWRRYREENQNE